MNKKIKNSVKTKSCNIEFKSKLEKTIYDTLKLHGFNPEYEPKTFVLIDSFEAKTPYFDKETDSQYKKRRSSGDKSARLLVRKSVKHQSIKYTPDFYFKCNDTDIYIEAKGFENDVFYIKKKLFLRYLNDVDIPSVYFEIYTKQQLLQAINYIKNEIANDNNKATFASLATKGLSDMQDIVRKKKV